MAGGRSKPMFEMRAANMSVALGVALIESLPPNVLVGGIVYEPIHPFIVLAPKRILNDIHLRLGCLLLFEVLPLIQESLRCVFYLTEDGKVMDQEGNLEKIDLKAALKVLARGTLWTTLLMASPPERTTLVGFGQVELYRFD
jgi:hypothetical protein